MKRLYYLFVLLTLLWCNNAFAYDIEYNGIYYNALSISTLEVTSGDKKYEGEINVPNSIIYNNKSYDVVAVSNSAFQDCDKLISVNLGNNIRSIGSKAFWGCTSLKNIPNYSNCQLGSYVFAYCTSLKEANVRGTVSDGMFFNCTSIETIPNSDYCSFGASSFSGCTSLKGDLKILRKVGFKAFENCAGISSVIVGSFATIDSNAFLNCSGIQSVELQGSATIKTDAFAGCLSLKSLTIKGDEDKHLRVSGIGKGFGKCNNLEKIELIDCNDAEVKDDALYGYEDYVKKELRFVMPNHSDIYVLPLDVKVIDLYAFTAPLKRIVLSGSKVKIHHAAFYNCPELKELYVYNRNVNDIEFGTFLFDDTEIYNLDFFTEDLYKNLDVYVPNGCSSNFKSNSIWRKFTSVKEFDALNFDPYSLLFELDGIKYKGLSTKEVEVIHKDDYSGDIIIPEAVITNNKEYKVTSIGRGAFNINTNSDGGCKITSIQIPNNVTSIGSYAFQNCELLKEVKMPDDIVCVDTGTFTGCRSLESITLPRKLQEIKYAAFTMCSGLKSIEIPNQVFRIEGFAFQNNKSLKTVITSHGLKEIYYFTFSMCDSLQTVVLGDNVEKIGCNAFEFCRQLSRVYSLNPAPPALNQRFDNGGSIWNYNLGNHFQNTFEWNANQNATLYVPIGSKEAYQNDREWGKFKNIIEFDPKTFDSSTLEIKTITNDEEEVNCYSLDGRKLSAPSKGINIIKMKDGTVKKVLVK